MGPKQLPRDGADKALRLVDGESPRFFIKEKTSRNIHGVFPIAFVVKLPAADKLHVQSLPTGPWIAQIPTVRVAIADVTQLALTGVPISNKSIEAQQLDWLNAVKCIQAGLHLPDVNLTGQHLFQNPDSSTIEQRQFRIRKALGFWPRVLIDGFLLQQLPLFVDGIKADKCLGRAGLSVDATHRKCVNIYVNRKRDELPAGPPHTALGWNAFVNLPFGPGSDAIDFGDLLNPCSICPEILGFIDIDLA